MHLLKQMFLPVVESFAECQPKIIKEVAKIFLVEQQSGKSGKLAAI